jgi:hypothetical protein
LSDGVVCEVTTIETSSFILNSTIPQAHLRSTC